jgi:Protein of unknown function (DUF3311)
MPSEHKRPGITGPWVVVLVLLAPAVVLPLLPGIYAKQDPMLGAFPFFFWFQFALILLSTVLTSLAYLVASRADRRDRVARGLPPVAGKGD